MRVLITGAAGFLGSEVVRQAQLSGLSVRATSRHRGTLSAEVEFLPCDILNAEQVPPLMAGIDGVIHVAGLAHIFNRKQAASAPFQAVNEMGTANIAKAAAQAGVKTLVLASSVSVYGQHSTEVCDEQTQCNPQGPYAESKWLAEQMATEIATAAGMRLVILRLSTLYGEGDPGNLGRLMSAIDRGRFIWIGSGANRKSLLHCEDAARACLVALRGAQPGVNIYNVSAAPCTMREIVETMAKTLGRNCPRMRLPSTLTLAVARLGARLCLGKGPLAGIAKTLEKFIANDSYPADKFQRDFDFHSSVSLTEGMSRQAAWYKKEVKK